MTPYWVTFKNKKAGCVEGVTLKEAREQAEKIGEVVTFDKLPYPAEPRLSEKRSDCPPFCYTPSQCKGRGSCPKSYACSE